MDKKQTAFSSYLRKKGIRRSTLSRETGIPYHRITTILRRQLEPSISEAHKISTFLEKPIEELFPESFLNKNNNARKN